MLDDLPEPIKTDLLRCVNFHEYTPAIDSFGIKELIYCLRQTYLKRTKTKPISLKVAAVINRGVMLDRRFTSLFPRNQIKVSYRCKNSPVSINGKLDFYDENNVLTELKFPVDLKNVCGVSIADKKQVQFYAVCERQAVAQVLYFDGLDCKKYPVDVYGWELLFSELEVNAALLYHCLVYRQLPEKTKFCSLCGNCEYQNGDC
jgi:CRISPR-associated exonuclease Cas4